MVVDSPCCGAEVKRFSHDGDYFIICSNCGGQIDCLHENTTQHENSRSDIEECLDCNILLKNGVVMND